MGTFGTGNFDSDAAMDILDAIRAALDPEIDGFTKSQKAGIEDLEAVLACVAVKNAMIEQCCMDAPSKAEATLLRDKILSIFDQQVQDLDPAEGYAEQRREVIVVTLDKLLKLAVENA